MNATANARTRRRAGPLLGTFPRLLNWWPVAAALVAVVVVVGWKWSLLDELPAALWLLRGIAVLLVLGCVFLYDDPSWVLADASPTTRRERVGPRIVVVMTTTVLTMLLLLAVIRGRAPVGSLSMSLAVGMFIEFLTLGLIGTALAVSLRRWLGYAEPGQFAAAGLAMFLVSLSMIQQRWPLLAAPGPEWTDAHRRWLALAVVAGCVIAVALRDPAARLRPRSAHPPAEELAGLNARGSISPLA